MTPVFVLRNEVTPRCAPRFAHMYNEHNVHSIATQLIQNGGKKLSFFPMLCFYGTCGKIDCSAIQ